MQYGPVVGLCQDSLAVCSRQEVVAQPIIVGQIGGLGS
jgi:hypothetical protein